MVVAGAVLAAAIGAGAFVPSLVDASDGDRTTVTTPDTAGDIRAGTITAAYVGPAELVFVADGGETVSLPVVEGVVVTTAEGVRIDYDRFTRTVESDDTSRYHITVEDGFVTEITGIDR